MAYNQSTGHTEVPVLSPETLAAVELLLTAVRDRIPHRPTTATQAAVDKVVAGFDRVGMVGRPKRMCVVIDGDTDPTRDPRFLGDPPVIEPDGTCSNCGDPYDGHWDSDSGQDVSGREWHRRDNDNDGYYSDEIPAVTR